MKLQRSVSPRKKGVFREDDVSGFTSQHGFDLANVEHVPGHSLDGALAETSVSRRGWGTKEESTLFMGRSRSAIPVRDDLEPYHLLSYKEQILVAEVEVDGLFARLGTGKPYINAVDGVEIP